MNPIQDPLFSIQPLSHEKNHQTEMHAHEKGQLYLLTSGVITCVTRQKQWAMVPHDIGWIPPQIQHGAFSWGNISGWSLQLSEHLSTTLPKTVCVFQSNAIMTSLIERIATIDLATPLTEAQKRILAVLLDELTQSNIASTLQLPYPTDPRLIKITQQVIADFTEKKTQVEWAKWAGISVRSFSRHFMKETGLSFARWLQLAKIITSLEKLVLGNPIHDIAYSLGYSNPSSYIAAFKSILGTTPGNYFTLNDS